MLNKSYLAPPLCHERCWHPLKESGTSFHVTSQLLLKEAVYGNVIECWENNYSVTSEPAVVSNMKLD